MKAFSILGGTCYVVELPEDSELIGRMDDEYWSYYSKSDGWGKFPIIGNWQIVDRLSEVTEAEAAGIVEYTGIWLPLSGKYECYMDYVTHGDCKTAIQSLESVILAEGWYLDKNPLGKEKEHKKKYTGHDMFFANHMDKWQTAQARVISRERTLILRRVEG